MPCSGQKEIFDATGNVIKLDAELDKSSFGEMDDYIWDMRNGLTYEKPNKNPAVFDAFNCCIRPDFYWTSEDYVIDKYTSLMCLRDELPAMTFSEFEKLLAENSFADYSDWRIPEMKELSTIVRRSDKNKQWFDPELFPHIYDAPRSFFIARETFNGMFNRGCNMIFAYDGYYADRLNGKYRIKAVRNISSEI